ncbi:MAG: TAXI family TRAP transporter solute-binding subunit [Pseudomonadota bacterium]
MFAVVRRVVIAAIALFLIWSMVGSIRQALPPKTVFIETGPVGGSYHENALRYASKLDAAGLRTEVLPNPQSLETINKLNDLREKVDIGFTVQPLDDSRYPNVASVGVIELQPLFVFYNLGLGKLQTPMSLRGKRLVMPPEKSATAEAARSVLGLYGLNEKNTTFTYLPISQAVEELKTGKHDAGFFMLAPANKIIHDLVSADTLSLLSIPEAVGVSRILDHLKPATVPLGAFDLQNNLPDSDTTVISGMVNVMVKKDINPAVLYVLLDAMKDAHHGQTLVSAKGDFPSMVGTELEVHPLAAQWAKSGTPWIFVRFGPVVASLIDKYWLLALVLVLLAEVYRTSRYLYELTELSASSTALRILLHLQKRLADGRMPGRFGKQLFRIAEAITARESQNAKARALLEQLRPVMTKH